MWSLTSAVFTSVPGFPEPAEKATWKIIHPFTLPPRYLNLCSSPSCSHGSWHGSYSPPLPCWQNEVLDLYSLNLEKITSFTTCRVFSAVQPINWGFTVGFTYIFSKPHREPVSPFHKPGTTDGEDTEPGHGLGDASPTQEVHHGHTEASQCRQVQGQNSRRSNCGDTNHPSPPLGRAEGRTLVAKCWDGNFHSSSSAVLLSAQTSLSAHAPALTPTAGHGRFRPSRCSITLIQTVSSDIKLHQ